MEQILNRAAKGDREAMAQIVGEHYPAVYRFCARRVGVTVAEDAAQETFLTAQKSLSKFDGRSSFLTWLLGIANNHCRAMSRKQKLESPMELWKHTEVQSHEQGSVDRVTLKRALDSLSPEHLEVVLMHEVEGLTYDEAAAILGVPAGTVKSRLHHAFLNLRRFFDEQGATA